MEGGGRAAVRRQQSSSSGRRPISGRYQLHPGRRNRTFARRTDRMGVTVDFGGRMEWQSVVTCEIPWRGLEHDHDVSVSANAQTDVFVSSEYIQNVKNCPCIAASNDFTS